MPTSKKSITLDRIYKKLTDHDKRFDRVDTRLDGIDKRLDGHDKSFDRVEKRLDGHDKRFTSIDGQFRRMANAILDLKTSFSSKIKILNARIASIEKTLEKLTGDVEKITQEYHLITAALKRIERILGGPEQWPESIHSEIHSLKVRVSILEERMPAVASK